MASALRDLLQNVLKVRPEEASRTALAFVYLFCAIGAFIIGRVARTVLFYEVKNYEEQLPLMYVIIAISVSLIMYAYARVERKLRRDHTNAVTLVLLILVTLGFRVALRTPSEPMYWAYYVWVEILGSFLVVQFWTFANEIFHSRQAKRLFAVIGGGGVLSNVVIGFGISGSVKSLGTENLLYVICGLLSVSLVMVLLVGRTARSELVAAHDRGPVARGQKGSGRVFATRHVKLIAAVVVVTYLVSTLADYQFQIIIGEAIKLKDERSAYLGSFFGITGILAGIIQFSLTSRILERFGVLAALALLPAAMLAGSGGVALLPAYGLWAISATKGAENVLRYTVSDSTMQLLYLPVPAQIRGRVKAWIDGILKPLAIGGAGLLLALAVGKLDKLAGISLGFKLNVYSLSWIVMGALVLWMVALVQLRKEYLKSLLLTLQRRRLNFADGRIQFTDDGTIKTIERALGSTTIGDILHALELLPFVSTKAQAGLHERVAGLLKHEDEEIRVAALKCLAGSSVLRDGAPIAPLLEERSAKVRAAAAITYCALAREKAIDATTELLDDAEPEVRAAAVAGLIRYSGLDGVLACADTLKRMLAHADPAERQQAAWVLGEIGVQSFCRPLLPLFEDKNEGVRFAAIAAAGKLQSAELIPALLGQLGHPHLGAAAAAALASYGSEIEVVVASLLADTKRPAAARAQACRILARLGDAHAAEILCAHLDDPEPPVRTGAIMALSAIVSSSPGVRFDKTAVRHALRAEAQRSFELIAVGEDLGFNEDRGLLLQDALAHRREQAAERLFGLLSLLYATDTIELVRRNLQSSQPTTRANAVEVLDNLLQKEEKTMIVSLFDDAPGSKKLGLVADCFEIPRKDRVARLTELLASRDTWMQLCAAMAAADWGVRDLAPAVQTLLEREEPLCRETAIVALRRLSDLASFREKLVALKDDPAPSVGRYAAHVLAESA